MIMAPAHPSAIVEILLRHPVRGDGSQVHLLADVGFRPVRMRPDIASDASRPERIGMARQPDNDHSNSYPKPKRPEQGEVGQGSDVSHERNIGTGSAFVKSLAHVARPGLPSLIRPNILGGSGGQTAPRPLPQSKAP